MVSRNWLGTLNNPDETQWREYLELWAKKCLYVNG